MKKISLSSVLFFILIHVCFGQTDSAFVIVENPAQFPNGGQPEFYKYLVKNLKFTNPTDSSYQDCTRFIVSFTIEKDGKASDVRFRIGCSDPVFQSQVVEAIKKMPLWKPATSNGQAVRMSFTIPFRIKLE